MALADPFLELSKGAETGTWHIYGTKTCIYLLYVIESYVPHPRLGSPVTDCHTEKLGTACVARSPSACLRDPAEQWVLADGFLTTQGFTRVADSERSALAELLGKDGVSQVRPLRTNKGVADMVRMMTAGQLWCQKPTHSLEMTPGPPRSLPSGARTACPGSTFLTVTQEHRAPDTLSNFLVFSFSFFFCDMAMVCPSKPPFLLLLGCAYAAEMLL